MWWTPDQNRSEMIGTGNKVRERGRVWRLCEKVLRTFFPEGHPPEYDSLAITSDFRGSPHVDKKDMSHQYVLALGDFEGGSCASRLARMARRCWRWT